MARESKNLLPQHNDAATADAHPAKKGQNPLGWHLREPTQGPRKLAIKNHFVAMVGEYVGTTLFLLLALGGTNVANIPTTSVTGVTTAGQDGTAAAAVNTSSLLYIALSFGFSLAVNAWIFFRVSGGLFNPAVSLGMALVGAITPLRAVLLTIAQILGGITGAALISTLTPGTLNVRTELADGVSIPRGLFIEMFMTAMLMITILLLAAEKHKATFLAPVGIGLALFIAEMMSVYYTGGSLNPARSFGPSVVLRSFNGYHWIYWLGPALGAIIAAGFYKFIKYLEYETVLGPEADADLVPAQFNQASSGGAPAMTGDNTVAGKMWEEKTKASGPTMAVQGAGLGDLLTHGSPSNAFDLTDKPVTYYDARLDRIEALLGQLISSGQLRTTTLVEDSPQRSSLTTLNDADVSYPPKVKTTGEGFENNGRLDAGYPSNTAPTSIQGHVHGISLNNSVPFDRLAGHVDQRQV